MSFILILAFTIKSLLINGWDKMFFSGLAVLVLIFINFIICLWQWKINNCFEYVNIAVEEEDGDGDVDRDVENIKEIEWDNENDKQS